MKESQNKLLKIMYFFISFSEDQFVLAINVGPDEMLHNAAFHLGLHCFAKAPVFSYPD